MSGVWDYRITRRRVCSSCDGAGGWQCSDKFQECSNCNGDGVEVETVSLETALRNSEIFRDCQNAVDELINYG